MSLSKNKLKWIRSLSQKKYRDAENCFLAEGHKAIEELSASFSLRLLLITPTHALSSIVLDHAAEVIIVNQKELEQASCLKTPQDCLAVFEKPTTLSEARTPAPNHLVLALDGVQDPGNLGTIIRLADWFGIGNVYCSCDCADAFSPKTVQATMGALARVKCHSLNLSEWLSRLPADTPIFGTFLDGENVYEKELPCGGVVIMGSEGRGVSPEVAHWVNERLYIPPFPPTSSTVESLNVAIATAVICAEFRRQNNQRGHSK